MSAAVIYSNNLNADIGGRSQPRRNDEKWEKIRDDVYQVYMLNDCTLTETISLIKKKHRFKASERTWKTKLKAWGFEKNLCAADLAFVIAKLQKRKHDAEKETIFFYHGAEVTAGKIARFKRRKVDTTVAVASPGPHTPCGITYHTPRLECTDGEDKKSVVEEDEALPVKPNLHIVEHNLPEDHISDFNVSWAVNLNPGPSTDKDNPIVNGRYKDLLEGSRESEIISSRPNRLHNPETPSHPEQFLSHEASLSQPSRLLSGNSRSMSPRLLDSSSSHPQDTFTSCDAFNDTCFWDFLLSNSEMLHCWSNLGLGEPHRLVSLAIERRRNGDSITDVFEEATSCTSVESLNQALRDQATSYEQSGDLEGAFLGLELLMLSYERQSEGLTKSKALCAGDLARISMAKGDLEHAEQFCRQAVALYESGDHNPFLSLEETKNQVLCQERLVYILRESNRSGEIEMVFLHRLCQIIKSRWRCNAEIMRGIISSLMNLKDGTNSTFSNLSGHDIEVGLNELAIIFHQQGSVAIGSLGLTALIRLAAGYSRIGKFNAADVVFRIFEQGIMQRLLAWSEHASRMHYERSLHFSRQGQTNQSLNEISLAFRSLRWIKYYASEDRASVKRVRFYLDGAEARSHLLGNTDVYHSTLKEIERFLRMEEIFEKNMMS